jgi:hypothetical protein
MPTKRAANIAGLASNEFAFPRQLPQSHKILVIVFRPYAAFESDPEAVRVRHLPAQLPQFHGLAPRTEWRQE